jgi:general L-amino acid transport system permease protein
MQAHGLPARPTTKRRIRAILWECFCSSPANILITLVYIALAALTIPRMVNWLILEASLAGDSRSVCGRGGACWTFVKVYLGQFVYGRYPADQRWRVDLVLILFVALLWPIVHRGQRVTWLHLLLTIGLFSVIAAFLMLGGTLGLPQVETDEWGGVTLNIMLWFGTTVGLLPIGILLALGRRSELPVVRVVATGYIEFFRGVPLVTVLFAASVMVPLFLPSGMESPKLMRALVALILFHAAYMAEVVRGGLQALGKGQYEAANSLGLRFWQSMAMIILPQALRAVIPGIANVLIGLLQGTSLVTIIGLVDLLGVAKEASSDPDWLGLSYEAYIFVGAVFFFCCSMMAAYFRRIERGANW